MHSLACAQRFPPLYEVWCGGRGEWTLPLDPPLILFVILIQPGDTSKFRKAQLIVSLRIIFGIILNFGITTNHFYTLLVHCQNHLTCVFSYSPISGKHCITKIRFCKHRGLHFFVIAIQRHLNIATVDRL